jgi:uncharacterized protein YukE
MSTDINIELHHFDEEVTKLCNQKNRMNHAIDSVKGSLDELIDMWDGTGGSYYADSLSCIKAGFIDNSRGLEQLIQKLELACYVMVEADTTGAR